MFIKSHWFREKAKNFQDIVMVYKDYWTEHFKSGLSIKFLPNLGHMAVTTEDITLLS